MTLALTDPEAPMAGGDRLIAMSRAHGFFMEPVHVEWSILAALLEGHMLVNMPALQGQTQSSMASSNHRESK